MLPRVRIPLPVVILLCLTVVGVAWWVFTKKMDFMTPPTRLELAAIRARVEQDVPEPIEPEKTAVVPPPMLPPVDVVKKDEIDLGNLLVQPKLDEYIDHAPEGAEHLLKMADLLERQGEFQRALFACERVIDSCEETDAEAEKVVEFSKRLKTKIPDWCQNEDQAILVTLHAGTGKSTAKQLSPVLEAAARELERHSAGILKVKPVVTASSRELSANGPPPVAVWMAGPNEDSPSTDVLSFTVSSRDTLRESVLKTCFSLIHGTLARSERQLAPIPLVVGGDPAEALKYHISRLAWQDFGLTLNPPPKEENSENQTSP